MIAGPVALAFRSGGFFDEARSIAATVACLLLALAALAWTRPPLPRGPGLVLLGGLAGLTAWTALSSGWAPDPERARDDLVRLALYTVAFALAASAWSSRSRLRLVEPLVAVGVLAVVGYGLAGRLVPGIVELESSLSAAGRLEQPLTYWNAMGALAAIGFVLCARVAGEPERPAVMRAAAAAASAPLGMGVYLSFSRGALGALAAGLVALVALAPHRPQLRALGLCVAAGGLAALASSLFAGVESLAGGLSEREREGAVVSAILALLVAGAALVQLRLARAEAGGSRSSERLRLPVPPAAVAGLAIVLLLAAPILAASFDRGPSEGGGQGATAARFSDLGSNRYQYWEVALTAFASNPLQGVGSGGFEVEWRREREIEESARDAHSLELETAAELGLVGLLLLALVLGGAAACGRAAFRADPRLAAGPCAALVTWAWHSALDWDWEMPALTLPALVLAGVLAAAAGPRMLSSA
ncbi:MAG TPA: O-antigen ligase family protein [Thermoleophilaceae bacterium]|nr:O-antigen ligase family protein [Thermoleophilaceae bacterium]